MFTAIGAYIKNIALLMLIAIFSELLVPDAKIKKYVSVIVGMIMIFTIAGGLSDIILSISGKEIEVTAFENIHTEIPQTENVRERLTGILYDEMIREDNVDSYDEGLNIHVEDVAPYN